MKGKRSKLKIGGIVGMLLFLAFLRSRGKVGTFLGIPYDLRLPTPKVIKERVWNPEDDRVFTPHIFGWGWSINLHALGRRLGILRESRREP
jgi:hypothetical protein